MIIQSEKDLKFLQGKFVIEINDETPDKNLMEIPWPFAKEKRLKIVSEFGFVDLFGCRTNYKDFESFKRVFNDYLFNHMIEKGEKSGGRFHRLLTQDELQYLFEKIKSENY